MSYQVVMVASWADRTKLSFIEQQALDFVGPEDIPFDYHENYLVIFEDGKPIRFYHDNMEPEDAKFCRDLDWIQSELKTAYAKGKFDQENEEAK